MAGLKNLDLLTDKIFQDGISKAEKESAVILSNAEKQQQAILEKAREEATRLVNQAKREAEQLRRSVEQELQLKGKQFISDLQEEIRYLLKEQVLSEGVKEAFADAEFMKTAILAAIKNWNDQQNLELMLPRALEQNLTDAFKASILRHSRNLKITFSGMISGGFRLSVVDESYQISFSEHDFIHLFEPYLSKQTRQMLIGAS